MRPGSVFDPVPQGRVVRHVAEHIQILDAPVPQMGLERLQKIVLSSWSLCRFSQCPRSLLTGPQRSVARAPQTAAQLVEVPTERGCAFAIVAAKVLEWRGALANQLDATPVPDRVLQLRL